MLKDEVREYESSVKKALYVCFDGMFSVILLRFTGIKDKKLYLFPSKTCF